MPRFQGEQASPTSYLLPAIIGLLALAVLLESLGVIDVIPNFGTPRAVTHITYPSTY